MIQLNYSQKLNLLAHNENTLALWVRNTMALLTFNMLFILLFKKINIKYNYIFFILPILSLILILFSLSNYKLKHDSIINNIKNDELILYYNIGKIYVILLIIFIFLIGILIYIYYINIIK